MTDLLAPIQHLRLRELEKQKAAVDYQRKVYIDTSNLQKNVSVEPIDAFVREVVATGTLVSMVNRSGGIPKHVTNDPRIYQALRKHHERFSIRGELLLIPDLDCRPTLFIQFDRAINFKGCVVDYPSVVAVYSFT